MNKKLFSLCMITLMLFSTLQASAQVAINTDNSLPDPSAGLDVKFPDKGVLIPRITYDQRNSIASPAEGLMVFCTNCGLNGAGVLCLFTNGTWISFSQCNSPAPTLRDITISPGQIAWRWNQTNPLSSGYKWNTSDNYNTAIDMGLYPRKTETGILCNTQYTRYVWAYFDCGVSVPLTMTYTTPASIPNPATAAVHYGNWTDISWNWNSSPDATGYLFGSTNDPLAASDIGLESAYWESGLTCQTTYTRYLWAYNGCGIASTPAVLTASTTSAPLAPNPGTHVPSLTQIIWNWGNVNNATGYKWNTINNYGTAVTLGSNSVISKTETGLTCGTAYTRYLWSYSSACGAVSNPAILTQSTLPVPPAPVEGIHVPWVTQIIWKWNSVPNVTGYKWNTINDYATASNLGSATSYTETGLNCGTTYTKYLWSYSVCGTVSSPTILTSQTMPPPACGSPVTDTRDLLVYNTVLIGCQCWMAQNLNYGTRINATTTQSNNSTVEKYCYNDDDANCGIYGGLYAWNELMNYTTSSNSNPSGRQGVCPAGWHVPSDAEWAQLMTFLGGTGVAGGLMKETGTTHWKTPNTGATNTTGFTGLPGGNTSGGVTYNNLTDYGFFWSSMEVAIDFAQNRYLRFDSQGVASQATNKASSNSARCLKDF